MLPRQQLAGEHAGTPCPQEFKFTTAMPQRHMKKEAWSLLAACKMQHTAALNISGPAPGNDSATHTAGPAQAPQAQIDGMRSARSVSMILLSRMAWGPPVVLRKAATPLAVLFLQLLRGMRGGCSQVGCKRISSSLSCLSSTYKARLIFLVAINRPDCKRVHAGSTRLSCRVLSSSIMG